ncbi:sigma factor-like helix-turn-helix DNA-binding protein [Ectobacillus ponti]|uniref:RNA polymerase sigma-70 region 4 domain-containing protein n=1 Tax=Ectobacillus ponti TaxID=2961894 RepID=A0AA41X6P0_9BACI|nr:sigma factor-like helix-turn-helix DNA-binding protein [Ectobacillus ponti]MCP8969712.1 hypothetical protein [Ectobacillus ponti]
MYDWLKDYHKIENQIAYLEFNLEQTERELKRWVDGDLQKIKLQSDSAGARVEDKLEQIRNELTYKQEQRNQLILLVSTFKGLDEQILKLKYIDGLTLDKVAEQLGYSDSHIKKRHAELVRTIKFVEDYIAL